MPVTTGLAVGSRLAGKYRIEKVLGEGAMGAVYLAVNEDIGREVAIKLIHAEVAEHAGMVERFRREARAAAAIGHPGIVDVLDLGRADDGTPFMVMERLHGETLGERLERVARLSPIEAAGVVVQVLDALAAAHDVGIIHRDLKPDNVFLVSKPVACVKVLDFGIALLRGDDDVRITQTGTSMGTPLYMSPEQARDASVVGPAADLYGIGALLFYLIAGRPPFWGDTYNQVLSKVLTEPAPALVAPGVSRALASLVASLLAKTPAERPESARAVKAALIAAVAGRQGAGKTAAAAVATADTAPVDIPPLPVEPEPAPAAPPVAPLTTQPAAVPAPPPRRHVGAFAVLGLAVLGAGIYAWSARSGTSPAGPDAARPSVATSAPPREAARPDALPVAAPDAQVAAAVPPEVVPDPVRPRVPRRPPREVVARPPTPPTTPVDAAPRRPAAASEIDTVFHPPTSP